MSTITLLTCFAFFVFGIQAVLGQGDREKLEYQEQVEYDKLTAALKNADQFTGKPGSLYFAGEYGTDWLARAISKKVREKWADRWGVRGDARKIFDKALDQLAATAEKKLPSFKPDEKYFAFHNKEEEASMKAQLDHPDQVVIHKIGLISEEWKQGSVGPEKFGYMWATDQTDDHSYCHLYKFRLTRAYIGNGKYSDSCDASLLDDGIIVGCP